ncbi:MAG: hypothetical protein Q9226_000990 [Calogaya cf. arnoldii]
MPMINSRNKKPPRSKKRAQGRSGRQETTRERLYAGAEIGTYERRPSSPDDANQEIQHPSRQSETTGTPRGHQTGPPRSRSLIVVLRYSVRRPNEMTGRDPQLPQATLAASSKAAVAGQVSVLPQATQHLSALTENKEPRLQLQHESVKANRNKEKWEGEKTDAVARIKRTSDAIQKAKSKLDKEQKALDLNVKKAFRAGVTTINHAKAAVQTTKANIVKIEEVASDKVDLATRAGEAKIRRAQEALQLAEANKNRASEAMQALLAAKPAPEAIEEGGHTVDGDGNSDFESDYDPSEWSARVKTSQAGKSHINFRGPLKDCEIRYLTDRSDPAEGILKVKRLHPGSVDNPFQFGSSSPRLAIFSIHQLTTLVSPFLSHICIFNNTFRFLQPFSPLLSTPQDNSAGIRIIAHGLIVRPSTRWMDKQRRHNLTEAFGGTFVLGLKYFVGRAFNSGFSKMSNQEACMQRRLTVVGFRLVEHKA